MVWVCDSLNGSTCTAWTQVPDTNAVPVSATDVGEAAGAVFGIVMGVFTLGLMAGALMKTVKRAAGLTDEVDPL